MRRRRPVDPAAARRYALHTLAALARQRDVTAREIHETAAAAHDGLGLPYSEIAAALGLKSSAHAWHLAHDYEATETDGIDLHILRGDHNDAR